MFYGLTSFKCHSKKCHIIITIDSEEFNDIHFFGSLLVIPVLFLVLTIIFAYLSIKSNTNK